jgi:DNA polymerase V
MFALVDVNNFYASCEAVFDVGLRQKPLVVLSNNDGCVIARSAEAKALGIKMAEPWHHARARHPQVLYRSSNYELYADMSARVMSILTSSAPAVEVYSIDESFLDLHGIGDRISLSHDIRTRVRQWTGLSVCVGIGCTKTRAKLANHIAKVERGGAGVFDIETLSAADTRALFSTLDVGEVWGIGRRLRPRLAQLGITTVQELVDADSEWIRAHSSVVLQRTREELCGQQCLAFELAPPVRKQLVVSRSFGTEVEALELLRQAALTYVSRAGEKLRAEALLARYLHLFVHTNRFREDHRQYAAEYTVKLPIATDDTLALTSAASFALDKIFRGGFKYHKCGVMLSELSPRANRQATLFVDAAQIDRRVRLNATIDRINGSFGRDRIRVAATGLERSWSMQRQQLSPCYTTRWSDLAIAVAS